MVDLALAYAEQRHWAVFQLAPNSKEPFAKTHGFKDATNDPRAIASWPDRDCNLGIATGAASGLVVIDGDTYKADFDAAAYEALQLPPTLTARTAHGGRQHYFKHPGDGLKIKSDDNVLGLRIDVKADGGYVVAPGSVVDGKPYTWEDEHQPIADLPPGLLVRLFAPAQAPKATQNGHSPHPATPSRYADDAAKWIDEAIAKVRAGMGRSDACGKWLCPQLRDNEVADPEGAVLAYARAVRNMGDHPYTEQEALAAWRSVSATDKRERARSQTRAAKVTPLRPARQREDAHGEASDMQSERAAYRLDEIGNAERLLAAHGANIRFCKAFDFCVWDGTRWRADAELTVRGWAIKVVRGLYAEANELTTQAQQAAQQGDDAKAAELGASAKSILDWARKSQTNHMVSAMVSLIKDAVQIEPSAFDAHPMLFNCANGTIDLRTGTLREHRRDDFLMQCSPIAYDPKASAPLFLRFMRQIMCERDELVGYLQRVLGYAMTGDTTEQEWYLLLGPGENGKSTLMEAVASVLGDFAGLLEPESITATGRPRDANAPSPDMATLKGKRLVKVTETADGARIDAAKVKKLSGGDELSGRHLHKDPFRFMQTHKLFIYTNHRPQTRETTHAFWRRVRFIPFDYKPPKPDKKLLQKLQEEAAGILAWLVQGCLAWQRDGLNPPEIVLEATKEYRAEMDVLASFIRDCCDVAPDARVSSADLYGAYKTWCAENGERDQGQRRFGMALTERGFTGLKGFGKSGAHGWLGIELLTTDPTDPTDPTSGKALLRKSRVDDFLKVGSEGSDRSVSDGPATCEMGGEHAPRKLPSGRTACKKCGEEMRA